MRFVACARRVDSGGVFVRRGVESRRMVLMGFCGSDGVDGDDSASTAICAASGWIIISSIVQCLDKVFCSNRRTFTKHLETFLKRWPERQLKLDFGRSTKRVLPLMNDVMIGYF